MRHPQLVEQLARVLKAALQAIEHVVVGQREDVEAWLRRNGPAPPCQRPVARWARNARRPESANSRLPKHKSQSAIVRADPG